MIDCRNLSFSSQLSQTRVARAQQVFGIRVLERILCFSLYLLGVNRKLISQALGLPPGSTRSIIRALHKDGLSAFEDRRQRTSSFLPPPKPGAPKIVPYEEDDWFVIDFGVSGKCLKIPRENHLQIRTVLLSMLNSDLLSPKEVAACLGFTSVHTWNLAQKLHRDDIPSLIDKRQGQKQDYRVPPEVKAELIQQFALDVVSQGRTSGKQLSQHLHERCNFVIPERTVRYHVAKLGLSTIKHSLPQLLATAKKTPRTDDSHER